MSPFLAALLFATAAVRGTPEQAQALLAKAVAHLNDVGRAKAFADFSAPKSQWKQGDLYVFCADRDGVELVNAAFPSLVGTSANAVHDTHGVGIGTAAWKAVAKNGSGSVEYAWTNPVTKNTEPKISFVQKVDADVLCGVGAYKQPR